MQKIVSSSNKLLKNFILYFILYYVVITVLTAICLAILEVSLERVLVNILYSYVQIGEDFILLVITNILAVFLATRSTFKTKMINSNDFLKFLKNVTIFFVIVTVLYIAFAIYLYDFNYISICFSIITILIYIMMFSYLKKITFKNLNNRNAFYSNNIKGPKPLKKQKRGKNKRNYPPRGGYPNNRPNNYFNNRNNFPYNR